MSIFDIFKIPEQKKFSPFWGGIKELLSRAMFSLKDDITKVLSKLDSIEKQLKLPEQQLILSEQQLELYKQQLESSDKQVKILERNIEELSETSV